MNEDEDEGEGESGPRERLRENATGVASTVVTGVWLVALLTGQSWWLGALIFGYVVVVPLVGVLFGDDENRREWWKDPTEEPAGTRPEREKRDRDGNRDALETLRRRYARGNLTDEQFERKLERLLETETLEAVEDRELDREHDHDREHPR